MFLRRNFNLRIQPSSVVGFIATVFLFGTLLVGKVDARDVEKQIKKEFDVDSGGTLFLDSDLGSINVRGHSSRQVVVEVYLKADTNNERRAEEWFQEFELAFEEHGKDVDVRGKYDRGFFRKWRQKINVHFDILVPDKYNLDLKTAGGGIDVADIGGNIELRTSGGGIEMGQIDGSVIAVTSGGSISLRGANGRAELRTSGGRISAGEVKGSVNAETSGGGIDIDGVDGDLEAHSSGGGLRLMQVNGNLVATTSGGSITAELLKQIDRDVKLSTSGGGISLDVPDNLRADLNASTSGGDVSTDLPITIQGKVEKSSLYGKFNGGGPELYLRSSGGGIVVK